MLYVLWAMRVNFFSLANVEDYREVSEGRANGVETSAWMELFFKEITVASRTLQE
jgi:hypothetical protein